MPEEVDGCSERVSSVHNMVCTHMNSCRLQLSTQGLPQIMPVQDSKMEVEEVREA